MAYRQMVGDVINTRDERRNKNDSDAQIASKKMEKINFFADVIFGDHTYLYACTGYIYIIYYVCVYKCVV